MGYEYTGDAHRRLVASYAADEDPFKEHAGANFPPRDHMRKEVAVLKRLLFPTCWNAEDLLDNEERTLAKLNKLGRLYCAGIDPYAEGNSKEIVDSVIDDLPDIRDALQKDVEAAYKGDPAAKSYTEIIRSYPGFHAIMVQRVAHAIYEAGASEYARELTEYAKTETGIDIHPGADIGEYFFIDHGTGVVIGESATVGDWARIYQNVTLGALHFEAEEDEEHMLKKGYKRHPDIGDHVVIGAGTNIMGPISIGDHVSIGANSWITDDIPDNTTVYISDHPEQERKQND
ncbi:serine O-acetyltransferase EpsC [Haloarculaceae archaeon H-GB2-1]|nr:serine acetyltransferase [Haloarculaceae archaeon H-GB1-1]MEA5387871.1 serine O-acetyltransferase EpsC [Haloarculaceae archaeon H-GB11]MEA5409365.1 serine O-acetyltransferase EpsC [Haloarculaceae archaeon H-GB2-1]